MKRRLHYLLIPLLMGYSWSKAQNPQWEKVEPIQTATSEVQSKFQEMFQDKAYSLGSEGLPSPRSGAACWQTGAGEWILFSGAGYDPDGNWGLLDDLWKYTASGNSWTLLKGQRKVDTKKWSEETQLPIPRRNAVSWNDNQGNLYLMGGTQLSDSEYFYDLWKYSVKAGIWTRLSEKTAVNVNSVWGEKKGISQAGLNPGSRAGSASWTDKNGNLWLFGGSSMQTGQGLQDLYNDLWMYSVKGRGWTWISGSDKTNQKGKFPKKDTQSIESAPSGRANAAAWYDDKADKLWLYGGNGIDTTGMDSGGLADLWSYDIAGNSWQWEGGSAGLFSQNEGTRPYPGYRWSAATWKDKDGNFLLYGGQNKVSNTEIDINPLVWKFDPKARKWSMLLVGGSPGIMSGATGFTDTDGNLLLFGGRKFNPLTMQANPTNEIWKIRTN